MLKIVDLKQTYFYGTTAIEGINIEIAEGEKIAVLALSRGGKTSLLKCIQGLYPANGGQILLDGKDITNEKIKNRDVRMVYDDGGLIRKRNVRFNLEYPLKIRKLPKNERFAIAYKIAEEYGLLPFFKETTFRLFETEIVSLALARLELRESKLTLIDDIFALLNGEERVRIFNKFLPKLKNLKESVIFTTSSLQEAFSFGDRIMVLNSGCVHQIGSPEELLNNPATLFVDEYVHPYKTRIVCGTIGNMVEIDNVRLQIEGEYDSTEVFISYLLKNDDKGTNFVVSHKKYIGNGQFCFYNSIGEAFIGFENEVPSNVSIDLQSIKLFHRITEKSLTFTIL